MKTLLFLIDILLSLYIYVILLRLLLQAARINFNNPLSQFALKYTQIWIGPLQKFIPEVKRIDLAVLVFALFLEMLKFSLSELLVSGTFPDVLGLLILSAGELLRQIVNTFFYAIIIKLISGWFPLLQYNAKIFAVNHIAELLLRPVRQFVPMLGAFDLSPLLVLILLQLFEFFVALSLMRVGAGLL